VAEAPETTPPRFAFGQNWRDFLRIVDEDRIAVAEESVREMLAADDLRGRSFLDIGCGSGIFSLAAARLRAERIHSFDFDPDSVAATQAVRVSMPDANWMVERGDVTSEEYCSKLGTFDVVYAWGVLHHTGAMWKAMANSLARVAPDGLFLVAIYNDQHWKSRLWLRIKSVYNRLPQPARVPYAVVAMLPIELRRIAGAAKRSELCEYIEDWTGPVERGMSRWHDMLDWVGGYPFEVATPEEVFRFCRDRGFELLELTTAGGGSWCNQFVFKRSR
jgi:SAM-dependent methyltransferase